LFTTVLHNLYELQATWHRPDQCKMLLVSVTKTADIQLIVLHKYIMLDIS